MIPWLRALRELFELWYDTDSIIPGQGSLLKQISAGLHKSDYGVVILSEAFFRKKWPQYELDGIFDLEIAEQKIMIPVWYKIGVEEVRNFSAIIAAQPAIRTNGEIEPVVADIIRSVDAGEKTRRLLSPLAQKLQLVGQTATLNQKFEELSRRRVPTLRRTCEPTPRAGGASVRAFAAGSMGTLRDKP